jgi:hypothetical protein
MEGLGNFAYECTTHPYSIKTSTPRSGLFIGNLSDVMDDYEIKSLIDRKFTTKKTKLTTKMIYMCSFSFLLVMSDTEQVVWMVGMDKFFLGVSHVLLCLGFYGVYIYSPILDEGPLVKPNPL